MDSVSGVGVLDKSVSILAVLAAEGPVSLPELVARTGIPRATVHRLASALESHELVGRDGNGRFRLGVRLFTWGMQAAQGVELVEAAIPVLAQLCATTGESAQLYVREGDRRVCVAASERQSGLRDTVPVGSSLPLTAGSAAKVILAWASDVDRFSDVDPDELTKVRRQGWAESFAEREAGVASVSAPVFDVRHGSILGVISVSGPSDRLGRRLGSRYSPFVVDAARKLEQRVGFAVH